MPHKLVCNGEHKKGVLIRLIRLRFGTRKQILEVVVILFDNTSSCVGLGERQQLSRLLSFDRIFVLYLL